MHGSWDAVFLCVDSTALGEALLAPLASAVGDATIVPVSQGPDDAATLAKFFPSEQVSFVVPRSLLAWDAPLDREVSAPGTAYWSPGGALAVSGPPGRAAPLVEMLERGGLRATLTTEDARTGAIDATSTVPYIAALQLSGWSLRALRQSPWLDVAMLATAEARDALAAAYGMAVPARRGPSRALVRLFVRVVPWLVPFDLQRYLAKHFSKVSTQTLQMLEGWAAAGRQHGRPISAIDQLAARLRSSL